MIVRILSVSGVALAGIVAIYASASVDSRADFVYVNPSGIHTLDPARMSWTQDLRVAMNIWEGLTTSHPETTAPVEGAALFPPLVSDDGLTYTFSIRSDARWSNGDPVTAGDFVRGWRRAMEPGTAADYLFFFTDYIDGAAEYVRWRLDSVSVLTALSRLRDGVAIEAKQAKSLVKHRTIERILDVRSETTVVPAESDDDAAWQSFAGTLNSLSVDWSALADSLFDDHVAALDERFGRVGLTVVDERTLQIQLARSCPYFLDLAAFATFLPCHESIELLRERHRGAPLTAQGLVVYDPQWTKPDYAKNGYPGLITNGPYRLSQWRFKRRLRLEVNPYYRAADEIACRTIDMAVYENVSAAIMAYEAGDVDFLPAMDVPYDHEIVRLARSGERKDFHLCRTLATYFLNFNCQSDSVYGRRNPFVDVRVRRAFTLATDRETIVHNVLGRGDRVAQSFVPRGAIDGYDPPDGLGHDPDEARRLLIEAGYATPGSFPVVELLYVASDERVCQALARMWERQLGVRVELRALESKTFAEEKANQRFMIARGNWYADYYDPTTFLDCLLSDNGNNDSRYSSPRYDELLTQAAAASDANRRARLLRQAERIIVEEDCPILPILHYAQPIAIKPWVEGLYPNARLRFPFRFVRVNR